MTRIKTVSFLLSVMLLLSALCGIMTAVPCAAAQNNIIGDFNRDGAVTTIDARDYLIMFVSDTAFSATQQTVADMDGDGNFTTTDVRLILQHIVSDTDRTAVRSMWIPYFEVESLLSSGNVATARSAIDACLQDCADRGANTVYFHVRANSDAYYDSAYYNANPKAAPLLAAGFDPLACAVELAHQKGLKLEAWVNPYRIGRDASRAKVDATFEYNSQYYYVPTNKAAQALVVNGVKELVNNYDIDGVQFDDYFYPENSVSSTALSDFETADYNTYKANGGTLSIADWRRSEVTALVAACYAACHTREGCVYGISPSYNFDSNYNLMYADVALWAKLPGYVDYLTPQLYTGFEHQYSPYDTIIAQWNAMPRQPHIKIVAGLALYKTGLLEDQWAGPGINEWCQNSDMMSRQIALANDLNWDGVGFYGHVHFTIDSTRDAAVAQADNDAACKAWLVFA